MNSTAIRNTIDHLRLCQKARVAGHQVSFTTDPIWLVNQAINRRAGWPDDPSCTRGSALPVNSKYPAKASGDYFSHLRLIAHEINTPRLIIRAERLGECRKLILKRLPERIWTREEL